MACIVFLLTSHGLDHSPAWSPFFLSELQLINTPLSLDTVLKVRQLEVIELFCMSLGVFLAWSNVHLAPPNLYMYGLDALNVTIAKQQSSLFSFSCLFLTIFPASQGLPCILILSLNISLSVYSFFIFDKLAFVQSGQQLNCWRGQATSRDLSLAPRALLPRWQQPTYQHLWVPYRGIALYLPVLSLKILRKVRKLAEIPLSENCSVEITRDVCENTATKKFKTVPFIIGNSEEQRPWWLQSGIV